MSIKKDFFAPWSKGLGATRRAAMLLLVMMLTATTAWAGTVDVTVNVTGSGSVSIGNQTATAGNPFTASVDDGASVTLTLAPDAGNIVTGAKLSYKTSEYGSTEGDITVSGSTATFQMPNNIWNGTGVTINVTFGDGLIGGADEASAVALTDATVSNLAGGYYKVESDISFDHTLNLIGDTYLVIASGAKMTVSSSEYGINGGSYALNVLGEGTLNVTTTGSYKIAVYVSSYTQSGCSVNLNTTYIGMRCSSFNISGGSFKTNGSEGIWPNNAVNISGGKLEASNIDANINLSYSNTDDYIKVDNYTSGKTMTIANGQTFTDGTTNYSGTITNLSPLNGKKLFPFVYTHLTKRDATCTEVGIKQECWQRSSDGKYFSDENGTNELNASDVEIPMIAHNGVPHEATDTHIAYWQCSMCSKYFSEEGCTTEITEEDTKIYRTITIDGSISGLVTSNVDKAVAGTTVTLTVSHLIDASTLRVNDGSVTLTDAGNGTYTFTVPAADVTVTASTATTYSVNLPANMEIVSATNTADGSGKYISGTVVTFKASFSYTASNVHDGANTLTADGSGNYSVTVGTADITVTATIEHSSNIDLSQAPSDFTVVDGDVLTGSTSHTVTIAADAKITLSGVTITGGIVCAGTAEITLVGENAVGVTSLDGTLIYQTAGIQIGGSGTTLTIKGNGSLNATGGSASAGIGLGRTWDANATGGSVVIEGGIVNASGGNGIGTGTVGNNMTATIGDIIIKGGTVNARLGKGTINNGSTATIGAIKIYDTIDKVDASKITESVTYMHDDTDVTASASTYFTIIEDGDRRIIEKKDNTDYSITITDNTEHGTIECTATTAKYGDKVTITTTSDFGYRFDHLIVKDADNNDVASTGNSFFMPKSNVTVSAVFEEGTHGTTEFAWGYFGSDGFVTEATIYDGVTTVNLQQGRTYQILKYDEYSYRKFLLDSSTYEATIPYSGGTGTFTDGNGTDFSVDYNGESGFYDITMTDAGNGKWSVSILKTEGKMDNIPDQTYTGSEITPEPLVLAGSLSLTKGTDYVYSYTNNTNVGTAKVRATFQGTYASLGYVEKEFTILPSTVMVSVTGSGTVTCGDRSATDGTSFGVMSEKGASVVLTLAPTDGYAARSVAYGYTNNSGTTASGIKLPISGTIATLTVPDDLKDGTGVTVTVTFAPALNGGADEASAVALTDATVTDLGGGWYKVENDISFDHTLNLLADTYLTIAEGKTMSVNTTSGKAIDSEYTLNVSGEGALNITTTEAYKIAVRVGSYVQTGATVTANGYIGIRCKDNFDEFNVTNDFTFSGGQLTATGSGGNGIWADNDITLSCTNATDFIQASSYSSAYGAVKIAEGNALTDGTEASNGMNGYSGTLTNEQITAIGGKTLHRAVTTSYVDASGTLHENVIAIPLDNTMTTLAAGWYVVNSDVDYTGTVTLSGDVSLILKDGATMTAATIDGSEKLLTVYAQTEQTGQMVAAAYECGVVLGQRFVAYNMASEGDISATAVVSGTISDVKTIAGKTLRPIAGHLVATPAGVAITGKTSPDFTITTGAGTESEATTSYYIISAYNTVTLSYAGSDFVMLSGLPEGTTLAAVAGQPMQRTFTMPATDVVLTATPVTGLTASGTYTYDGQQQTPAISLNESAFEATNYTVSSVAPKADSSSQLTDGKAVNAGEYSVTITGLGQYVGTTSVDFTINPKPVTIATVDVNDKVYDGTTNATLSGTASFVDGMVVEGDEVSISVSGASAVFADRYVGDNKDATVTGLTLAGGSKDNYTLTAQQASAKASIKPAPVTVKADDKSKEWGTADDPELTATVTGMAAGEALSLISYTIAREKGEFSDSKENSGEYTITPTGEATQGNYAVTYQTGTFTIEGKQTTIKDVKGDDVSSVENAYTITEDQNGVTLTLVAPDAVTTPQTVNIPVAVEVDHVAIDRLFASGKAATVYLPFSIEVSKIGGGTFHTFLNVDETTTPQWTVTYSPPLADDATLQAGTPYIFMPDGSNGGKIVVNNGNDKISICTANPHTTTQGLWEFIGTYNPIVWLSNPAAVGYNAQRAAEIGYVYGFAAEEKTFGGKDYTVGQFVKIGSGASIDPNRAYLKRNVDQQAPALGGSGRTAVELPSAMRVVILSANSTTGIVEMRNENEEMRNDTWHTLGGRRLQGKPSGRGMYIHNGRKVVLH